MDTQQTNNTSVPASFQESYSLARSAFSNDSIYHRASYQPQDHRQRHNCYNIAVYPGGIKVKTLSGGSSFNNGGSRGYISGFSKDSKRRLRDTLMQLDWESYDWYWVTLTYHNDWSDKFCDYKRDLQTFIKRLQRKWGTYEGLLWRLQFQKRGVQHFHLIVGFRKDHQPDVSIFRRWASKNWAQVIGGEDDRHLLRYGVKTIPVNKSQGVGRLENYLLSYLQEDVGPVVNPKTGEILPTGRCWATEGNINLIQVCEINITDSDAFALFCRRINKMGEGKSKYLESINPNWKGFVILGDGIELLTLIDGLPVEYIPASPG